MRRLPVLMTAILALAGCDSGDAVRDQVRAVGSSTVYPFAKAVAEELARSDSTIQSPIIESTGTGAGMNLFCAGLGPQFPDIADASRRIKKSEFAACAAHGVRDIAEIEVGLDGVAFAQSRNGPDLKLSPQAVYRALAKTPYGRPQTARTWHDVDPALPSVPILVYGPPSTSGTRDALRELILVRGCNQDPAMAALAQRDPARHDAICGQVREDGGYVDAGENDNLIVQKIEANPTAIGVFGYSYLEQNADRLVGLTMDGVRPTYATIADFSYPGARPLYIYVKKAHLRAIPGLAAYVAQWAKMWGRGGSLARLGMVVAPDAVLAASARKVVDLPSLDGGELK